MLLATTMIVPRVFLWYFVHRSPRPPMQGIVKTGIDRGFTGDSPTNSCDVGTEFIHERFFLAII